MTPTLKSPFEPDGQPKDFVSSDPPTRSETLPHRPPGRPLVLDLDGVAIWMID